MRIRFAYQKIQAGIVVIGRPYITVTLFGNGKRSAAFLALLDSGCDSIILPADLALAVDIIDIGTGTPVPTTGFANQSADIYLHKGLSLRVMGDTRVLSMPIGFCRDTVTPLVGRALFHHFTQVIFKQSQEEVELIY